MNNNWLGTTGCVYSVWHIWLRLSVEREIQYMRKSGAEFKFIMGPDQKLGLRVNV